MWLPLLRLSLLWLPCFALSSLRQLPRQAVRDRRARAATWQPLVWFQQAALVSLAQASGLALPPGVPDQSLRRGTWLPHPTLPLCPLPQLAKLPPEMMYPVRWQRQQYRLWWLMLAREAMAHPPAK